MSRRTVMVSTAIAALAFAPLAALAAPQQTTPGTPGDANCTGQTNAFLAQLVKNADARDRFQPGIGNLDDATGLTRDQLKGIVANFCNQ